MLTFLENILEVIEYVPQYILYAIETLCNLFFAALQTIFSVATSLIGLPEEPVIPEFIANINWFFPLGAVISIMGPIVAGYVTFLGVRYIYRWVGAL